VEDPYKILGISSTASEDELTQAYRRLAKKYHPDINPGDKNAEIKMKEINAAYEQVKKQRTGGANYEQADGSYGKQEQGSTGGGYQGDDPFGGFGFWFGNFNDFFGSQGEREAAPEIRQVQYCVENRRYQDALRILSVLQDHTAEWYFYSALANAGMGSRVTALSHAREAAKMEPGNVTYRQLLSRFEQGSFVYREAGERRGFNMQNLGGTLFRVILAQLFCMICCRCC
jgi:molecular chaperone DnaJ